MDELTVAFGALSLNGIFLILDLPAVSDPLRRTMP